MPTCGRSLNDVADLTGPPPDRSSELAIVSPAFNDDSRGMARISVDLESKLSRILLASAWFQRVLDTASRVGPADWLVGGGVIRTLVWDHLHGQAESASGGDVDLVYFDPADLARTCEAVYEAELRRALPDVDWDVKNQAAVHLWYPKRFGHEIRPIVSVEDGVARFPETAKPAGRF